MITVDDVAATTWRMVIADLHGARFDQSQRFPDLYRRMRTRDDGSLEVRYACDGDGKVTPSLGDVVESLTSYRETLADERPAFAVGDDARGAVGGDD